MTETADPRLPLKRRRVIYKRDYARQIEEVNKFVKFNPTMENVEQLEAVRSSMTKTKADLDDVCLQLLLTIDEDDEDDRKFQEELLKERDNFLMNLDRAIGACVAFRKKFEGGIKRDSLNASVTSAASLETNANALARLPKVSVPTFNGDLRKFLDFKALFENLVHQDELIPAALKMHYLKESLVDEAARTLSNLAVSSEGYKEAWGKVLSKYDNKRIIVHTHFNDLFCAERIRNESQLRVLLDQIDGALRGLRACGEATDCWSSILSYMLYTRLDNRTKADFDNTVSTNSSYYDFKAIWKFCETRANNVEARKIEDSNLSLKPAISGTEPKRAFFMSKITCVICQEQHLLIDCPAFMSKAPADRLKAIQTNKLCVNCFSRSHLGPACPSHKTCKICLQRHHYLLHLGEIPSHATASSNVVTQANAAPTLTSLPATSTKNHSVVVLPSAKVRFECGNAAGEARILLDTCSQPTLVSDTLVRKFKLKTFRNLANKPIRGVGFQCVGANRSCKLTLISRIAPFKVEIEADVISADAIPYSLSSMSWNHEAYEQVKPFSLADTAFYSKSPTIDKVDLILGAQYVELCLLNESVIVNDMVLRSTHFGWTLNGEFPGCKDTKRTALSCCSLTTSMIERQVFDFLDGEKPEPSKLATKQIEEFCESYFESTTTRDANGQFVVRLPFVLDPNLLGDNKSRAVAILQHSQARAKNEVRESYIQFMDEYEKLEHMSPVQNAQSSYFIPHHVVLRPDSTTTSTRVVFNASSPSSTGFSLNDLLAVGPQLQPELFDAILRFRSYLIGVTADITKMYRCILIHPDDRRFQQILWRSSHTEPIKVYQLNTVTYGTAPASFLAVRCLFAIAHEIEADEPETAQAIRNEFYMDDLLIGGKSVAEIVPIQESIHRRLDEAGLKLRKYQSNSTEFMSNVDEKLWLQRNEKRTNEWSSVLGVAWNVTSDYLSVRIERSELIDVATMTKRQMLAEIAKTFDPLGLIAPVTIRAKFLIKEAWTEKIGWDDQVSPELAASVREYLDDLTKLSSFAVPRAYSYQHPSTTELVGFCSASEKAYSATVYTRITNADQTCTTRIVCAKTRIASSKPMTVDKLELQSAVLLTELAAKIGKILKVKKEDITLCCNSGNTVTWIGSRSRNSSTFIQNRVEKIQLVFPIQRWRFIDESSNPARKAVLGESSRELIHDQEWTNGPSMLMDCQFTGASLQLPEKVEGEQRQNEASMLAAEPPTADRSFADRFNSYRRLSTVIGRLILFIRKWRNGRSSQVTYNIDNVSIKNRARVAIILMFQANVFAAEIEVLRAGSEVPTQSKLKSLDPFLDQDGVLRVRGRLDNSTLSFQRRCPIIIPKNCRFVTLYARYIHDTFCHATKSFVITFILAEFWVCGGLRSKVKAVVNSCVTCARYRAETYSQIMGQLPRDRITPSRPFSNVGLDFCGPFNARCVGHRSVKFNKIYACIFVCMCTRAVHIEITSNLTATHFLYSFHRFVARRGLPNNMYSDCGTNFVGANNYLNLACEEIQNDASTHRVKWTFNPPRSPHRGGIWESAVKSAKAHAVRVIGNRPMDFEEYVTLFTRIESILNSRPICYRNTTSPEESVITPSHFLIGSLPYTIPEPETSRLPLWRRYELLRGLIQTFWKSWRSDYLNMLQKKEKWNRACPNIQVGQLVLLKTEAAPCSWPLARIEEAFPGVDGFVRTVHIRVPGGAILRRDIRSLVKLPIEVIDVEPSKEGHVDTSVPSVYS